VKRIIHLSQCVPKGHYYVDTMRRQLRVFFFFKQGANLELKTLVMVYEVSIN